MITYIKQDVTKLTYGVIAHGTNCLGVMGAGIARAIKQTWPKVYSQYAALCRSFTDSSELLGMVQVVDISKEPCSGPLGLDNTLFVANCFTQVGYGTDKAHAKRYAVAESLDAVLAFAEAKHLPVYMPKIGCGLGGLTWDDNIQFIVEHLAETYPDVDIFVCDI